MVKVAYVIVPPNLHLSGNHYIRAPGHAFEQIDLAQAPKWLLDLIIDRAPFALLSPTERQVFTSYGDEELAQELAQLAKARVGERNECLNKAAFKLGN